VIREAKDEDAEQVGAVLHACYNISDISEGEAVFRSEVQKGHRYIAAEDSSGKIIGIVTLIVHGLFKHGLAELDRIAVLPEGRGTGIATALVDALVAHAQGLYREHDAALRKLYLLTHHDNERAQAFYRKVGFTHEATLPAHYYTGKDEHVFSMFFPVGAQEREIKKE